jgi:transposase
MSVMKGLTLNNKEQTRLSILNLVLARQCNVKEAAQLLGMSERHLWRTLAAYREEGAAALVHGNLNRLPPNTTSYELKAQVIFLASERYQKINHTHLTELLEKREGIHLSRSTVRRFLVGAGLPSPRQHHFPRHRYRRERMPQEGMLIQIDGSHHRWLEERGPWLTLILAIDDATGTVPYALFREQEDTEGYFRLMQGILQQKGIPLALYSDRYFVFRYNSKKKNITETPLSEKDNPTQFGRAMRELGVTQIFARSPEAKGRIERANETFQDRLVAELRLAGISTREGANLFLQEFLPRFNQNFGVPPSEPTAAYRAVDPGLDVEGILCFKERRRVAKDNTVQYYGQILQIFPGLERTSYARVHVEVQERLDGRLLVCYQGQILTPNEAPPLAASLRKMAETIPASEVNVGVPHTSEAKDLEETTLISKPQSRMMWYEDSEMKRRHRELVKAGMEQARKEGKRIGRPRVSERPDFVTKLVKVIERLNLGEISRRQAAKELAIGYATLKRLMDNQIQKSSSGIEEDNPDVLRM